jgi:NADH-quinone oxidoreductase subunit K
MEATNIPLGQFLGVSAILFSLGAYAVLVNFVAFSAYTDGALFRGLIFAIFVIIVAAAEVGLALGIIVRVFRNKQTVNVDEVDQLKW